MAGVRGNLMVAHDANKLLLAAILLALMIYCRGPEKENLKNKKPAERLQYQVNTNSSPFPPAPNLKSLTDDDVKRARDYYEPALKEIDQLQRAIIPPEKTPRKIVEDVYGPPIEDKSRNTTEPWYPNVKYALLKDKYKGRDISLWVAYKKGEVSIAWVLDLTSNSCNNLEYAAGSPEEKDRQRRQEYDYLLLSDLKLGYLRNIYNENKEKILAAPWNLHSP
jgi:hypothetical protein